MARAVELSWPGGRHTFALRIGELRELQDRLNAGPEEVFNRIRSGNWRVNDLVEVVRIGLVGGGMDRDEAGRQIATLIDTTPLSEFKFVAIAALASAIIGYEDDPVGEAEGEQAPPENGSSAPSMGQEPQ